MTESLDDERAARRLPRSLLPDISSTFQGQSRRKQEAYSLLFILYALQVNVLWEDSVEVYFNVGRLAFPCHSSPI